MPIPLTHHCHANILPHTPGIQKATVQYFYLSLFLPPSDISHIQSSHLKRTHFTEQYNNKKELIFRVAPFWKPQRLLLLLSLSFCGFEKGATLKISSFFCVCWYCSVKLVFFLNCTCFFKIFPWFFMVSAHGAKKEKRKKEED